MFSNLLDAARFAIELRDMVSSTRWDELGLPPGLGGRIALHAGPVFEYVDPLQKRMTCIGAHVSRTTRMIPVTPRGQVYASQEFAALCGEEGVEAVGFEFLGRVHTTKLFDDAPLYRLDRMGG